MGAAGGLGWSGHTERAVPAGPCVGGILPATRKARQEAEGEAGVEEAHREARGAARGRHRGRGCLEPHGGQWGAWEGERSFPHDKEWEFPGKATEQGSP